MFNLLPGHQKRALRREYITRVLVVALAMGSISSIVLFFSLLPAYSLSRSRAEYSKDQLAEVQKELASEKTEGISFENLQKFSNSVKQTINSSQANHIIQNILKYKTPGIKITGFDMSSILANAGRNITIVGVAPTRDSLLEFRKSLEKEALFRNINVPDSNFQKNKDISFSISFLVAASTSTAK